MSKNSNEVSPIDYGSLDELIDRGRASALSMAIQRIESGKASDGLLQMFIKGILPESQLDNEAKEKSLALMDAKINKYNSEVTSEKTFQDAMAAFAKYSGHPEEIIEDE